MKICFYTDTFLPTVGGAEMVLHHLALHISKKHDVVVLAPMVSKKQSLHVPSSYPVIRYIPPFSKRFMTRLSLPYLLWIYWRYGFDVLHCHAAYPQAYVAATFKSWFPLPVVVRPHGSDIVPKGRMRSSRRLENRLKKGLAHADAIVAQGRYLKGVALDLGVGQKRIRIIHNGIDLKRFGSAEPYPHPTAYILAVGSLIQRKGFDILLNAYKRLARPKPDLLIAGTGPEADHLKKLARKLHIHRRVYFLGLIEGDEKIQLYRSADFLVCPSRKEPFANVIIEALAADLPVIASAVDGNLELIQHEGNGLLYDADSPEALQESMRRLIDDRGFALRLGQQARSSVSSFDWPLIAAQYVNLYKQLHARYHQQQKN
jgi:glycosyltransferase involved in cell wall biosynthesis